MPLLFSVWLLQLTPPLIREDLRERSERVAMEREDDRGGGGAMGTFFRPDWQLNRLLIIVYVILTVARTIRDDFTIEIYRDMGVRLYADDLYRI